MLFRKKMRCCVCGSILNPNRDNVYQAQKPIGPLMCLTTPKELFDCVDCATCGCQNVLTNRLPAAVEIELPEDEPGCPDPECADDTTHGEDENK